MIKIRSKNPKNLYENDVLVLKRYDEKKFKLTLHRSLRVKGYETSNKITPKCSVNDEKLEVNISRARSKIFEYAYCNEWQFFVNLTLDKKKYDRYNLKPYIKDLSQWLRDYSRARKVKLRYLFIPEQHKDGAWHVHGLIDGIPECDISTFDPNRHPMKLIEAGYFNWKSYSDKFGFVSLGAIKDKEAVSKYITKYVTKDMANNNIELGSRLYYCSKGLKTAVEIEKGLLKCNFSNPDFENEHVKVKWLSDIDVARSFFWSPVLDPYNDNYTTF